VDNWRFHLRGLQTLVTAGATMVLIASGSRADKRCSLSGTLVNVKTAHAAQANSLNCDPPGTASASAINITSPPQRRHHRHPSGEAAWGPVRGVRARPDQRQSLVDHLDPARLHALAGRGCGPGRHSDQPDPPWAWRRHRFLMRSPHGRWQCLGWCPIAFPPSRSTARPAMRPRSPPAPRSAWCPARSRSPDVAVGDSQDIQNRIAGPPPYGVLPKWWVADHPDSRRPDRGRFRRQAADQTGDGDRRLHRHFWLRLSRPHDNAEGRRVRRDL
jgi:hypothetical protein